MTNNDQLTSVPLHANPAARFVVVAVLAASAIFAYGWLALRVGSEARPFIPGYLWTSYQAASGLRRPVSLSVQGERFRDRPEVIARYLREAYFDERFALDLVYEWLFATTLLTFLGGAAMRRFMRTTRRERTVRGPVLLEHEALVRAVTANTSADGIRVAGVPIPRRKEAEHIGLFGDTGKGKTTVLFEGAFQIRGSGPMGGPPAVIFDPDREFVETFFVETVDTILNPFDARSPCWSPWDEIQREGDALALAKSLIPDPPQDTTQSAFFFRAARAVLLVLLERTPRHDIRALARALSAPADEIARLIDGTPAVNMLGVKSEGQASGVLGTLAAWGDVFQVLPEIEPGRPRWSATEWMKDPRGWVFVTSTDSSRELALPLATMWIDTIIRRLLDRKKRWNSPPFWLIADEVQELGKITSFEKFLTRARGRGGRCIFGVQNKAQLEKLYGPHSAKTILSQPLTQLYFRSSEPETAKWISDSIGVRERLVSKATVTRSGHRTTVMTADECRTDAVVLPSEIGALPELAGFLRHDRWVGRVTIDLQERPALNPDFIARPLPREREQSVVPPAADRPDPRGVFQDLASRTDHTEEGGTPRPSSPVKFTL